MTVNISQLTPTPGQNALHQHARNLLPQIDSNSLTKEQAGLQLKKTCENDPIILNDILLSQKITENPFSYFSIDYLMAYSEKTVNNNTALSITSPFKFEYSRNDEISSLQDHVYDGGVKYPSTFECVMALIKGEELSGTAWALNYFPKENILTLDGGGNHRTLAHIICGDYGFTPDRHSIYTTNLPVPFLAMDRAFADALVLVQQRSHLNIQISKTNTEAKDLYTVMCKITPEIRGLLQRYWAEDFLLSPHNTVSVKDLQQYLVSFNEWKKMSIFDKCRLKWFSDSQLRGFKKFLITKC